MGMINFNSLSGSQKLTAVVTAINLGTAYYHFKGSRNALGSMFIGYSIANIALIAQEGF